MNYSVIRKKVAKGKEWPRVFPFVNIIIHASSYNLIHRLNQCGSKTSSNY